MDFWRWAPANFAVLAFCAIELNRGFAMSFCYQIDRVKESGTVGFERLPATSDGVLGLFLKIGAGGAAIDE